MKVRTGDRATLKWIVSTVKGKKRYVAALTAVQMVSSFSSMGYAVFLGALVDCAAAGNKAGFFRYCGLLVGLVVFLFVLQCVTRYLDEYCRSTVENSLKHRMFRNLLYKDYAQVTAVHSGDWITRMTSDASVVAGGVVHIVPGICSTVVRLTAALCLLHHYIPQLTGWVVLGGIAVTLFTFVLRKALKKLHKQVQASDSRLRVFLTERLNSMMVLRAFEKEETALSQAQERMREHMKARMRKNHILSLLNNGFSLIINCVYITGGIVCGFGIMAGTMSYGSFTSVLQLVSQIRMPISNVSGYFTQYSTMLASAERLVELENYREPEGQTPEMEIGEFYNREFVSIGLRNAGFTYLTSGEGEEEPRNTVLKDLSMDIRKGEYVAFCGPSGCGKSTVLKLLMCMYDLDEGERYVAGKGGEVSLTRGWRGLFSYVPQGNQLMSGTIREVVTFGDEAQEERIWQALRISCADSFIRELPEGLDTQLGERGAGLSEGQMQRIAIARAVFSDRPILLLDEATSALDEATEAAVLDNLRAMTDKTVIIVTHRPKALEITDKIIHFKPKEE